MLVGISQLPDDAYLSDEMENMSNLVPGDQYMPCVFTKDGMTCGRFGGFANAKSMFSLTHSLSHSLTHSPNT